MRQQYNFSPLAAIREMEDYRINLDGVTTLELRILPDIRGAVRVARWQSCSSHRYRVSPCLQWALLEPFPIRRLWADQNRLRFGGQQPAQRLGTVDCNGRPMVRGADVHSEIFCTGDEQAPRARGGFRP